MVGYAKTLNPLICSIVEFAFNLSRISLNKERKKSLIRWADFDGSNLVGFINRSL